MEMEFRPRNYIAEEECHELPRSRTEHHPLSFALPSLQEQVEDISDDRTDNFFDPLRAPQANATVSLDENQDYQAASTGNEASLQVQTKEWNSFNRFLLQRFPVSKMVSVSSISNVIVRSGKAHGKSFTSVHLEELDDPQKFSEEGDKVITRQEYVSRLYELKDEINRAWHAENRVMALKLSIKVARLLMDTSVSHFYPTLFVLATDVLDMLGDMVWERIKQKAELAEDGTKICSLPDKFQASDVCLDAKETCNNWFSKVGSIRELLPRIYLELAIMHCWHFLIDRPSESLQRLVMMTRGLADPLASAYCRLYAAHCAQKLPVYDIGYLVTCINDIGILLLRISSVKETTHRHFADNKRLLVSLIEPAIQFIMKCIFKDVSQEFSAIMLKSLLSRCSKSVTEERQVGKVLVELGLGRNQVELFGDSPCVSVVFHHLLKELPIEVVSCYAIDILHIIKCSNDYSYDQSLNYRLLGRRLCEAESQIGIFNAVVDEVMQMVSQYGLDEYLKVMDAFLDIVLQNQMEDHLNTIMGRISELACNKDIVEDELTSLQSILVKLLSHFKDLEYVFSLNHFLEISDVLHGTSRNIVNMHMLEMATRNGYIRDPTTIQLVFEISQALHDDIDLANMKNDDRQQQAQLITRYIRMVDLGAEFERHLAFLIECRGAFGSINGLKESLVHSSNCLAIKALKDGNMHLSFVKSCIAFSEVTIPSVRSHINQFHLYLESAEVALLCGLISHSDGLIISAINCLQNINFMEGYRPPIDTDLILSSIRKLCSLLIIVPGDPDQVLSIPKSILSILHSQSWSPKMKTRIFFAIVSLSATLSQARLPYHADHVEVIGTDLLFFGDSSYAHELLLLAESILQNLVAAIEQEPSRAARGTMALEACNCIAAAFKINGHILPVCTKLLETAKLCLSANDRYLKSTINFLDKNLPYSTLSPSTRV